MSAPYPTNATRCCPACLGGACATSTFRSLECRLAQQSWPSLAPILCNMFLFHCAGVHLYLPAPNATQMAAMYAVYDAQRALSLNHTRPVMQSSFIRAAIDADAAARGPLGRLRGSTGTGLRVLEAGCAGAYLLRRLAAMPTVDSVECFEADTKQVDHARQTLADVPAATRTSVVAGVFDADKVLPQSVDLFVSSQVIEHTEPCAWVDALRRVLAPGGYVFTDGPDQEADYRRRRLRGRFHLGFYNVSTYDAMMRRAGFIHVDAAVLGELDAVAARKHPGFAPGWVAMHRWPGKTGAAKAAKRPPPPSFRYAGVFGCSAAGESRKKACVPTPLDDAEKEKSAADAGGRRANARAREPAFVKR